MSTLNGIYTSDSESTDEDLPVETAKKTKRLAKVQGKWDDKTKMFLDPETNVPLKRPEPIPSKQSKKQKQSQPPLVWNSTAGDYTCTSRPSTKQRAAQQPTESDKDQPSGIQDESEVTDFAVPASQPAKKSKRTAPKKEIVFKLIDGSAGIKYPRSILETGMAHFFAPKSITIEPDAKYRMYLGYSLASIPAGMYLKIEPIAQEHDLDYSILCEIISQGNPTRELSVSVRNLSRTHKLEFKEMQPVGAFIVGQYYKVPFIGLAPDGTLATASFASASVTSTSTTVVAEPQSIAPPPAKPATSSENTGKPTAHSKRKQQSKQPTIEDGLRTAKKRKNVPNNVSAE